MAPSHIVPRSVSLFLLLYLLVSCRSPGDFSHEISLSVYPEDAGSIVIFEGGKAQPGPVDDGAQLTVVADSNDGWTFLRWKGGIPASAAAGNPLKVKVVSDLALQAVFVPRWNFLLYMAADNNLENWLEGNSSYPGDLVELERAGSSDAVEVLILLDRHSTDGTVLYRLGRGEGSGSAELTALETYGELDMSDPSVLENFLVYAADRFPARHTVLTLWSHGTGVYPRGIAYDDTTAETGGAARPFNCLTTDEVETALRRARERTGVKPDIIHTDACLMQMAETAWQWKDEAAFLSGSPAYVPTLGNDYYSLLRRIENYPWMTPEAYARAIPDIFMNGYRNTSGLDLVFCTVALDDRFTSFRTAFSAFAGALSSDSTHARQDVFLARDQSTNYRDLSASDPATFSEFVDLGDFLLRFTSTPSGKALGEEAAGLRSALDTAVISLRASGRYAASGSFPSTGLAILLPDRSDSGTSPLSWETYRENGYGSLRLSADTAWDELLESLSSSGK